MMVKKTHDELEQKIAEQAVDNKILKNNIEERCISDSKYAPIEVKGWILWAIGLVIASAIGVAVTYLKVGVK